MSSSIDHLDPTAAAAAAAASAASVTSREFASRLKRKLQESDVDDAERRLRELADKLAEEQRVIEQRTMQFLAAQQKLQTGGDDDDSSSGAAALSEDDFSRRYANTVEDIPKAQKRKHSFVSVKDADEDADVDDKLPLDKRQRANIAGKHFKVPDIEARELIDDGTMLPPKPVQKRARFGDEESATLVPPSPKTATGWRASAQAARAQQATQQPNHLSMDNYMRQLLRSDIQDESVRLRANRVYEKWEYPTLANAQGGECRGDRRVRMVREALAYIDQATTRRSKHQKLMHLAFEVISLQSYYGEELQANLVRLLRQRGFSECRSDCIVLAPRRFGKTEGLSRFAAAEIVTQPGDSTSEYGHDVLTYANNQRASKMMLMNTYKHVKLLAANPDFGGHVRSLNKNESLEFMTREGFINQMYAYPAKAETLRGTGSRAPTGTVIAEEFAYMNLKIVFQIIAPTLTRKNVKFIGITTVSGSDSFVTPLVEAKYPDGRSVMLTLNFELVCQECRKAGKAKQCKCLLGDIPFWQSAENHGKMERLMQGHMDTFMKELRGLNLEEDITPAFNPFYVEFLRTPESVGRIKEMYADRVYTAVDPAAGGKQSKVAIVSGILRDGKFFIVGVDICRSKRPEEQATRVVEHILRYRKLPGLEFSSTVFCPESNLGLEGIRIAQDLARAHLERCYVLMEDKRGSEGIRMTEELKKELYMTFQALMTQRRIAWHPMMICCGDDGETPESMRKMLIDELFAYQRRLKHDEANPDKPPREFFSGKYTGKGDDLCIAAQLCFKGAEFWNSKPDFYNNLKPIFGRGSMH